MAKTNLFLFMVLVMALIGIADTIHLLEIKYGSESSLNCDISEKFNCSSVNHSPWSQVGRFPTAAIGLLGYSLLGFMSFTLLSEGTLKGKAFHNKLSERAVSNLTLFVVSTVGFLIQAYFTYIEFFVLNQLCIFCLFSQALILLIMVFAYLNYRSAK